MKKEILEKYMRSSSIIQAETGTLDDFNNLKEDPTESNLVLIFMLGYFAANQYYTDEVRQLLKEKKLELKLSEIHDIVKEISSKPLN